MTSTYTVSITIIIRCRLIFILLMSYDYYIRICVYIHTYGNTFNQIEN